MCSFHAAKIRYFPKYWPEMGCESPNWHKIGTLSTFFDVSFRRFNLFYYICTRLTHMHMKRYVSEYWPYVLALLPVLFLRDFSPASELRYISLATELLHSNHFFCLTWQGENFYDTMPLYVWLVALLKVVFRHHYMVTIAGLFSLLPAFGILGIMNRWVERYDTRSFRLKDGSQSRILASIMLFTCGLQLVQSFVASPDMLFSFFVVCSLYTFWRISSQEGAYGPSPDRHQVHKLQWHFGIFVFLATFTKGPVGILLPLLCTTVYLLCSGRIKQWGKVWNWRSWLVLVSCVALWMTATYNEGGMDWIRNMMVEHPFSELFSPVTHDRPWYYFFISSWGIMLPWGPVCLVVLIISTIRRIHHGQFTIRKPFETSLQNFFVTCFLVILFYFSVRSSKLDVNLLPAYPFLVYVGVMQFGQWRWPVRWNWKMVWISRSALLLIFVIGCFCPVLNIHAGCYGRICYRANRWERELQTEGTYVYKLRRAKGMDAYLHHDPIDATAQDIADGKLQNTLMIMKEYRLKKLHKELETLQVPKEKQGEVIDELGAYVILRF